MNRIFLLLLSIILLSGCAESGLKKSANNKLIDTKGFHGGKRRPLYNKKYIDKAKLHIARGEFEDEEYDDEEQYLENLSPSLKNRYIYEDMIEEDLKAERAKRAKKKSKYSRRLKGGEDSYPDLGRGRDQVKAAKRVGDDQELKHELREIRTLLDAARSDLVKYRCPIDENGKPAIMQHEVKPKKIHEQVRAEEKAKIKAVAPKKKASHPPKLKVAPVAKVVKAVAPSVPQSKSVPAPNAEASKPLVLKSAPKVDAPAMRVEEVAPKHHSHGSVEQVHAGSHEHPHPHQQNVPQLIEEEPEIFTKDDIAKTISITPAISKVEELSIPQITEIPPAPADEASEAVNVPDLPSFPNL